MKATFLCALIVISTELLGALPGRPCPKGWAYDRGHQGRKCYRYLSDASANITAARQTCADDFNATLVSIQSSAEQSFVVDYVFRHSRAQEGVWLGASKEAGTLGGLPLPAFVWEDDSVHFSYTNWGEGAPRLEPDHSCVIMQYDPVSISALGTWLERPCNETFRVVCQLKSLEVATPPPPFHHKSLVNKTTTNPNPFRQSLGQMSSAAAKATPGGKFESIAAVTSDVESALRDHGEQLHSLHEAVEELHDDICLLMTLFSLVLIAFLVLTAMAVRRYCRRERRRRGMKALGLSEARNGGEKLLAAEPEAKKETCFAE